MVLHVRQVSGADNMPGTGASNYLMDIIFMNMAMETRA